MDKENGACGIFSSHEYITFYGGDPPELHLDKIERKFHTVLDVGCGLGRTMRPFLEQGCEITGIESDKEAVVLPVKQQKS